MKKLLSIWKWSLAITARSPLALLVLATIAALWMLGGYQWLWLPESSGWMLLLALVWAIIQIQVLVGVLAGTAAGSAGAAQTSAAHLGLRALFKFDRRQFVQCFILLALATLLVVVGVKFVSWVNAHSLEVASFLTFRSEQTVSPHTIERIWWWVALVVWSGLAGLLWYFLLNVFEAGWREARRQVLHAVASCCGGACLLTSVVAVLAFGGFADLLVSWHPKISPGFWDYFQGVIRVGAALLVLTAGWFFWTLALARMIVVAREMKGGTASPPAAETKE